jgi:hypothetical protein
MTRWVIVLRGIQTDDAGILDAERLIKDLFPESHLRATTVVEWMYDETYAKTKPFLDPVGFGVPEHAAGVSVSGHVRRTKGAQ